MSSDATELRHSALVYRCQEDYVTQAVAFLREGLRAGEAAVVANTRPALDVMREALGPDALSVTFVNISFAYTCPARTLAAYHTIYTRQLGKSSSLRAVADVRFGPDPGEWDTWMGYEAVLTRSFGHLPAWLLCTYNADRLPDPVLEAVWRTHVQVLVDGAWIRSERYLEAARLLREIAREPAPLTNLRQMACGTDCEEFREQLAHELMAEGVAEARALDMLVAATEVATNAMGHGGGLQEVRVGRAGGRFVCEIVDRGSGFDDPVAGYLAPRRGVGTGLWVARQLTWRIDFFRAPNGFTARIVL